MYYMKRNKKDSEMVELYEENNTKFGKITRFMAIIHIDSLSDKIIDDLKIYKDVAVKIISAEEED